MTNELPKTYDPSATEDKLYKTWEEKGYFNAEVDKNKKPFTIVIPPPNVTGQLHTACTLCRITATNRMFLRARQAGFGTLTQKLPSNPCREASHQPASLFAGTGMYSSSSASISV